MRQHPYFDIDEIREALPVSELLQQANIFIDGNRGTCPLCDGSNPTQFSIYADDTRWKCHTCGQGGDIFAFIMAKKDVPFGAAVTAAAMLAGIEPGPPPDPAVVAKRKAEREQKAAARAAEEAVKRDEATKLATDRWRSLDHVTDGSRACADYLTTRGLEAFVHADETLRGNIAKILRVEADGSPATPIYSFNIIGDRYRSNAIVGVARRQVTPNAEPKVLVGKGHKTEGTFGQSWLVAGWDRYDRVVVVEGVIDFLTATLVFKSWHAFPGTPIFHGRSLVLGAHSVTRIPEVVERLADDPKVGETFRKLPLLLVTHMGDTNGAGEKAEAEAMREASVRGMTATRFDLQGSKDLNDWFVARARS